MVASLTPEAGLLAQEPKKIRSIEAYDMLNTLPESYLIDIRSREEYQLVGHPVKAYNFPYMIFTSHFVKEGEKPGYQFQKNKAFAEQVGKVFKKTDNLLVLDRDGVRSAPQQRSSRHPGLRTSLMLLTALRGPSSLTSKIRINSNSIANLQEDTDFRNLNTDVAMGGSGGDCHGPTRWIQSTFILPILGKLRNNF